MDHAQIESRPSGPVDLPSPVIPREVRAILGRPALIPGEDPAAYERLLAEVSIAARPADTIEWLLIEDVVNLVWEAQRLRRTKAGLLTLGQRDSLAGLLTQIVGFERAHALAQRCLAGDQDALRDAEELLREAGLDDDAMTARAFARHLDVMVQLGRMLDLANRRRDAVLRELERRRDSFARRLRSATIADLDAE
jgi:hypothetical protein